MKCPLCGNKMEAWGGAAPNIFECRDAKCPAYNISLDGRIIRAIHRKLKAEYERGVKDGCELKPGGFRHVV